MTTTSERTDTMRTRTGPRRGSGERLRLTDPKPLGEVGLLWRSTAQWATIGMFFLASIAALYFARGVLLPVVTAVVVGLMLGPLSAHADRLRIPHLLSAIVLWILVVGVFYGVILLLAAPIADWIGKAPEIGANIKSKLHVLDRPIEALNALRRAILPEDDGADKGVSFNVMDVVQPAILFITPAVGQVVIFFGTLFFYLLGRVKLRRLMVVFFDERDDRLRMLKIMNDIEHNLTSYLSVLAVINLVVGIAAFVISYFAGLPNPLAWGVLGFILNFVPYIGALLMELILLGVGLVTFPTLTQALVAPLLYLAFTTLEGHFITPGIMGRRLTLNPLIVFMALVFWTWLWGPVGAFLAVPLLIVSLVTIGHLFPSDEPALPE
ncbi:MAG: AI-2E family transporter [Pseudolabrys sp.]|nr:AI-2E family transporter [Pseudolabrys sp.]MBV9953773.1 AI-2E family transporter [Pseudolabrys sp.]